MFFVLHFRHNWRVRSIAERRLLNHGITAAGHRRPADVVAWSGAVQAQEYAHAKWGVALRMADGASEVSIDRAFERGEILRLHAMRPTWHFVTAADIRWIQELTAPRVHQAIAYHKRFVGVDARDLSTRLKVVERALRDGTYLTRTEIAERLRHAKLPATGQSLAIVMMNAELESVVCSGPRRGNQFTYALVCERAPKAKRLDRDEALAELTTRYVKSHGPVTIRDFVWWSGLTVKDAKRGLDISRARREEHDGAAFWSLDSPSSRALRSHAAHLLPIYDEYLVAYRDRAAVPQRAGTFRHSIVIDGHVAGTWQPDTVTITLLRKLNARERRALDEAVSRYQRFRSPERSRR